MSLVFLVELQEQLQETLLGDDNNEKENGGFIDIDMTQASQLRGIGTCLDNCVASLCFLCGYQSSTIETEQFPFIWSQILSCLPLVEEEDESLRVMELLVEVNSKYLFTSEPDIQEMVIAILVEGTWSTPFLAKSRSLVDSILNTVNFYGLSEEYQAIGDEMRKYLDSSESNEPPENDNKKSQEITEIYLNNHF